MPAASAPSSGRWTGSCVRGDPQMSQIFAEIRKGERLALPHSPPYLRPSATSADHLPIPSARPILLQIALVGQAKDVTRAGDVAGLVRLGGADDVKDVEVDAVRL